MPLPYYVSPEQMMKDKAEYARKGISRGKAIVAIEYRDGILLVAENPSTLLHKISEIYDRIAFAGVGRLFKYDVTGGRYEETDYFAQGSGGKDARDSLKKRFRRDMSRDEAVRAALEALLDAADEDLGTGGPDFQRGIFPTVKTISRSGITDLADDDVRRYLEAILSDRGRN